MPWTARRSDTLLNTSCREPPAARTMTASAGARAAGTKRVAASRLASGLKATSAKSRTAPAPISRQILRPTRHFRGSDCGVVSRGIRLRHHFTGFALTDRVLIHRLAGVLGITLLV